jgi:hypothetical protein
MSVAVELETLAQVHFPRASASLASISESPSMRMAAVEKQIGAIDDGQRFVYVVIGDEHADVACLEWVTMRMISSTAMGSTPAKGSSSRMKLGLVVSARAISVRRRSPPDSM